MPLLMSHREYCGAEPPATPAHVHSEMPAPGVQDFRLIAPLPMRKAMYEVDFEDPNSLAEFNRLLQQADQWFEIPLVADEEAVRHPGPARDKQ